MDIFWRCKILRSIFCVCTDGFQGISRYPILTYLLASLNLVDLRRFFLYPMRVHSGENRPMTMRKSMMRLLEQSIELVMVFIDQAKFLFFSSIRQLKNNIKRRFDFIDLKKYSSSRPVPIQVFLMPNFLRWRHFFSWQRFRSRSGSGNNLEGRIWIHIRNDFISRVRIRISKSLSRCTMLFLAFMF